MSSAFPSEILKQQTLYESLEALPEGLPGELLNGQIYAHPRPSNRHTYVVSRLDRSVGRGYGDGADGPGGWWILRGCLKTKPLILLGMDRIFMRFDSYHQATAAQNDAVKSPVNPEKSC